MFPKSFIELIKEKYQTSFVASVYMTGPLWNINRGFNIVENLYDKRLPFNRFVKHFFSFYLGKMKKKEISKKSVLQILKKEYGELLKYFLDYESSVPNIQKPKYLGAYSQYEKKKIKAELSLLKKPEIILEKMLNIQPEEYFYSLGDTVYKKTLKQAEAKIKLFFSRVLSIFSRKFCFNNK